MKPTATPGDAVPNTDNTDKTDNTMHKLVENTAAHVSDQKIAVFNIWSRDYVTAAGDKRTGPAAVISTGANDQTVGVGSVAAIGGDNYDVIEVSIGTDDVPGFVVLRAK